VLLVSGLGFALLVVMGWAAGVSWGPPLTVSLLVGATAVAASGTLLLLMSLVRTERQGDALTTIVIIGWSMLGGAFVPIGSMPDFVRPLSATTLVFWATDGFNTVLVRGGGLADVAVNLGVLFGVGAVFLAVGALVLRHKIRHGAV
jgi:ABC-2 type transport system permease protein